MAVTGRIDRKYMAHYIDAGSLCGGLTPKYERLGQDLEEYNIDLNPDTETTQNILGQPSFQHNGYEASSEADPFYADPSSKLYPKIRDIALKRLKGDDCKTLMLEVIVEDTAATKHRAFVQEVLVKPQSYGGDTSGVNFPFDVTENGTRTEGSVTAESLKSGNPVFTAGEIDTQSLENGRALS